MKGISPGLARLHARRALWPGGLIFLAALALIAGGDAGELTSSDLTSAWKRQGLWSIGTTLAFLLVGLRAAGLGQHYRERGRAWIGARPITTLHSLVTELAGLCFALLLFVAAVFAVSRVSAGPSAAAHRHVATLANPGALLVEGAAPFTWPLGELPPEARTLSVGLTVSPGSGPAVTVQASLTPGPSAPTTQRLFGPIELFLPIPEGNGPFTLHVEREGPGAVLAVLPGTVNGHAPASGSQDLTLVILAWLALVAWTSVALAAGSWMRPAVAFLLVAATLLAALPRAPEWLPAVSLVRAFANLERGIAPPSPAASCLGSACLFLVSLAVAHVGRRRGGPL